MVCWDHYLQVNSVKIEWICETPAAVREFLEVWKTHISGVTSKVHCSRRIKRNEGRFSIHLDFLLHYLLEVLSFCILQLGLWSFLSYFFVKGIRSKSRFFFLFFHVDISSCSGTIYWKDYLVSSELLKVCHGSINYICVGLFNCICVGLFRRSLFHSIVLFFYSFTNTLLFW